MDKYLESAKEIDVFGDYDVIIVGGGVAGLTAAIACGRNKVKTLLVERFGFLGGTATASLMNNINGFRNQVKPDGLQTVKGIAQEIIIELDISCPGIEFEGSINVGKLSKRYYQTLNKRRERPNINLELLLQIWKDLMIWKDKERVKIDEVEIAYDMFFQEYLEFKEKMKTK